MKTTKTTILAAAAAALMATSCNEYLDRLPDDRAEVDTELDVSNLLVAAYATHNAAFLLEMSGDNVCDNGKEYTAQPNQEAMYRWEDVETEGNDDPRSIWNSIYYSVAHANQALYNIAEMGSPASLSGQKAEALLCRAYGMLSLANVFCMAYNPETAQQDLGLPYPTKPETSIKGDYRRGTMAELYANIDADIEEALPLLNDAHLSVPKYHFNTNAAYALAARFNLYYHRYDKAADYATKALGASPADMLRTAADYPSLSGPQDIGNAYIQSKLNCNLMLQTAYSISGRAFASSSSYNRFNHGRPIITYETMWVGCPWGSGSSDNTLYYSHKAYGSNQCVYFPKMMEMFEYKDKLAGTGYAHTVTASFTADETLLVRAEANALRKNYAAALADMNLWQNAMCAPRAGSAVRAELTEESVNGFVEKLPYAVVAPASDKERSLRKTLNPQGFAVERGTQENLLQLILQMRRIETLYYGLRFQDIKRYGIEFTHDIDGEENITFKAGDPRGAIQLPTDVIEAGLEANPREAKAAEAQTN